MDFMVKNVPLGCIIRKEDAIPEGVTSLKIAVPCRQKWFTQHHIALVCAKTHEIDNMAVFEKLVALTKDHKCWTHVKPSQ